MNNFSIKALGASVLTAGLVLAGFSIPAQAATLTSGEVSSPGAVAGATNPNPIAVDFTTVTTANPLMLSVVLPAGWSWVTEYGPGGQSWSAGHPVVTSLTGCTPTFFAANNTGSGLVGSPELWMNCGASIAAGTSFSIVLPAGVANVGAGTNFTLTTLQTGAVKDQATVTLNANVSSATVTFEANGGTGTIAPQAASSSTALTANAFTRSNYTFAGWNTAADGSGTAYADGAVYGFSANTTLYAQWTAALANTGFDGSPYLATGGVLALAGAAMILIARRRQSA